MEFNPLLEKFNVLRIDGLEYVCHCPICGKDELSVYKGKRATILKCSSGCSFIDIMEKIGLPERERFFDGIRTEERDNEYINEYLNSPSHLENEVNKIKNIDSVTVGIIESVIKILKPATNENYKELNDISNGKLFADIFRHIAKFNVTSNKWYIYNGIRWAPDDGNMEVYKLGEMLWKALHHYSVDQETAYRKHVAKLGSHHTRVVMVDEAKKHCYITKSMLDANTKYFNCLNVTIDLETFEILEHDPSHLLSTVANVEYNPKAQSEEWARFINDITMDRKGLAEYLQKIHGYGLTGNSGREECYFYYGASTRNGKSTLLESICEMMGGYSVNMEPETLAKQKRDSRQASGDIARLNGCRIVHCSEPDKKMLLDSALLKRLTGNDKITARFLHEKEFEFTPYFKLIMNTNYLPSIADISIHTSGRIKVVPFDRHFKANERDMSLKQRLTSKENLSAILNWCLDGLKKMRRDGMEPPEEVVRATEQYQIDSDKTRRFFNDCLESDYEGIETVNHVYEIYVRWCNDCGYGIEGKQSFIADLRQRGLISERGTVDGVTKRNVIKGYSLTFDSKARYIDAPLKPDTFTKTEE